MIKTQPCNNTHHDSTKMDKLKMLRIVAESIVKQEINRLKTERAVITGEIQAMVPLVILTTLHEWHNPLSLQ